MKNFGLKNISVILLEMPGKTYLTGKLALQRDNLLIAARKKNITWEMYHKDVAKLEKQQEKINEKLLAKKEEAKVKAAEEKKKQQEIFDKAFEAAKEALRKREEERKKKAEESKKKREEKKKEAQIANQLVAKIVVSDPEVAIRDAWKIMKNVDLARLIVNGEDKNITFGDYQKHFRLQFLEGAGSDADYLFGAG